MSASTEADHILAVAILIIVKLVLMGVVIMAVLSGVALAMLLLVAPFLLILLGIVRLVQLPARRRATAIEAAAAEARRMRQEDANFRMDYAAACYENAGRPYFRTEK